MIFAAYFHIYVPMSMSPCYDITVQNIHDNTLCIQMVCLEPLDH